MKIDFFYLDGGDSVLNSDNSYFIMNNEVYRSNEKTYESQCAVIDFFDCIKECPEIGWRVVKS